MGFDGYGVSMEDTFYIGAIWELKFAWLPHRCDITGKEIWFERAYRGITTGLSQSGKVVHSRWITKDVWLVEKLKGTI